MASAATEQRHLTLPTDGELDAAREALSKAITAVAHIAFRLRSFYDLEEAGDGRGAAFRGSGVPPETFEVPTLERIGALFLFGMDVERRLEELDEYYGGINAPDGAELRPSFRYLVEWLDVVRTAGGSGRVFRGEEDGDDG